MLDHLTLHQLRALDLLLELGSVTRTAERLAVSQSALSHTLRGLREALDDPLFVRAGGRMQPTPRAEALRVPLRRALHDLEVALAAPDFEPSSAAGTFSLGMPDAFAMIVMPGLLRVLRSQAPGLDLDVRPVPVGRLAEVLQTGELDLALDVRPPPRTDLRARALFRDDFVCMVCAAHPAREALDLDAYCALPHALISPTGSGTGVVDDELAKLGRSRRVAARVRYFLAAPSLLEGTDLVLTLPRRVAESLQTRGQLAIVEPPLDLPGFAVSLVWHQRMDAEPAHRWLRDHLAAFAS
ncbi:MAG: LysR family transcriptional regulator [Deltaproteobacteria bacterium]|nr:MAG: LysR family transcriptional regulator [Deltaproteobacteria bacterium]